MEISESLISKCRPELRKKCTLGAFPAGHSVLSICAANCPATNVFVAAVPLAGKIVSNPFEHVEKMRAKFSITSVEKKVLVGRSRPVFRMV